MGRKTQQQQKSKQPTKTGNYTSNKMGHAAMYDKSTKNVCRCADHLLETFSSSTVPALPHSMPQRSHQIMRLPRPKKEVQRRSPLYCAPTLWNSLLADLKKLANWNSVNFFFEHDLVCFQYLTMIILLRSHSSPRKCERTIVRCI